MSQSRSFVTILGIVAALAGGCSPFVAESFWGPAQKLSGLGATFAWRPSGKCEPELSQSRHPYIDAGIQERIETELEARGYHLSGKPDFYVCYRLVRKGARGENWDEAVLEVDLTDPNGAWLWRGRVRGPIDYSAPPDARGGRMKKAVAELMKPLPQASAG